MNQPNRERGLALIGGGARSGKSSFALQLARSLGGRRAFIATAEASDEEMRERIAAHARTRGDDFATFEEPLALAERIDTLSDFDVVVIDCLTLWLSNLLIGGAGEEHVLKEVDGLVAAIERSPNRIVVVTNEVGMGLVPDTPLGRVFRDVTGRAHQRLSAVAAEIYLAVLGVVLRVKPGPLTLQSPEALSG